MRIFQEEIFRPLASVTTCMTEEEALAIATDTLYGLARESGGATPTSPTAWGAA